LAERLQSVPKVLAALDALNDEVQSAKTYERLQELKRAVDALKSYWADIAEIKHKAEDVILDAHRRIGEELSKVPKASGNPILRRAAKNCEGRQATAIPKDMRSRAGKLARHSMDEVHAAAKELREQGKDATPRAVVTLLTQGNKRERRAERELELAHKQIALPTKCYGVIVEDFEWDQKVWSRDTGMDRHAANHYSTSKAAHTAEEIIEHTKQRFVCAADDCVLFMWTTNQHLAIAIDVMRLREFKYKTNYAWGKDKIGLGYWNREKHELLLVGTRGNIPCPAPGEQWESLIMAPRGRHSEKPEVFLKMIEEYFPNLPKIELNRRGPARPGWEAWGNEAEPAEAAE
jgi:N6-adenosine-specific RNA methylase IME4